MVPISVAISIGIGDGSARYLNRGHHHLVLSPYIPPWIHKVLYAGVIVYGCMKYLVHNM